MASSRRFACFVAIASLCALAPCASTQGFEVILWRNGGPQLDANVATRLKDAGVRIVSVDQAEDPRPVRELGLDFYLDHAAGKGTLHVRKETFEKAKQAWLERRDADPRLVLARPVPLLDEQVMSRASSLVRERAKRAHALGARRISLDDEISTTSFTNPIDWCHAPSTLAAMRVWLAARYGTVDELGRAWGQRFERFEDVVPPTTDQIRAATRSEPWPRSFAAWSDHREFMDIALARAVTRLAGVARAAAPSTPIGFEGGQPPAAFGGSDWSRLLRSVDWVEPYDLAGLRELVRSWRRPGQQQFETVFPESDPTLARRAVAKLWDAYAHALSGAILWSSEHFFVKGSNELSGYGELLATELRRLQEPAAEALTDARVYTGDIVILESQPSVRLHWMIDSREDGKTWPNRLASYDRKNSTMAHARESWVRLLQDLGYAFRFVAPRDLLAPRMNGTRTPRVLILPSTLALDTRSIEAIETFVRGGGLVLADETPARYDERLRRYERPALDTLFGVRREHDHRTVAGGKLHTGALRLPTGIGLCEIGLLPEGLTTARRARDGARLRDRTTLLVGDGERGARGTGGNASTLGQDWCQFEHVTGDGRAVLLNFAVFEYAGDRLKPEHALRCRDLRARVRALFTAHGIREVCLVRVADYPTILERQVFEKGGRQILVVRANMLDDDALFRSLTDRGPQPMTIVLPMAARLRDLFTGEPVGLAGREIQATLDPLRGSYFVIEPL
ncbi:MAG: beta-galactosidase [Planctomycetes bacterium]|nr:beta-galactosidase [Planctomycetota bacterium]